MLLLGANSTGSHGGDVAEAVDFDGTNDYLSRSSDLTGNADGKTFTFSCWVWPATLDTDVLYDAGAARVRVTVNNTDQFVVTCRNAANTTIFSATATIPTYAIRSFIHLMVSVDLSSAANRYIYINDAVATVTWTTYTNDNIDFTQSSHTVVSDAAGSLRYYGRLSHVFLDYQYRNLSTESERRKFITSDRKPADNQAALNPILYLPMSSPETVHINEGTGGNFQLNGVVARSGRGPNQFNAPYSFLNAAAQYIYRTTFVNYTGSTITVAFAFQPVGSTNSRLFYISNSAATANAFAVSKSGTNLQVFITHPDSSVSYFDKPITTDGFLPNRNYIIQIAIDTTNYSKTRVAVNGVVYTNIVWSYAYNKTFNFASTSDVRIGADFPSASTGTTNSGNVFFHTSYIDLSVSANLEKFCVGTGIDCKPVDMGANGELPLGTSPLIYLPMYANNAGKNYGTGGDFTVNSGPYTGARGPNEFWGNKADFDGSTGYLARTSALTGVSDGKTFSLVFTFSLDAINREHSFLYSGRFRSRVLSSNVFEVVTQTSAGSNIASFTETGIAANTSYTIMISLNTAGSLKSFYINNVEGISTVSIADGISNWSASAWSIGSRVETTDKLDGKLSEFYFTTDYIDFSQEANRLKFRDAFGNPVDLTAQIEAGEIPEPAIYMRFDPANQGKNYGTGGDFVKSGTILDGGQL